MLFLHLSNRWSHWHRFGSHIVGEKITSLNTGHKHRVLFLWVLYVLCSVSCLPSCQHGAWNTVGAERLEASIVPLVHSLSLGHSHTVPPLWCLRPPLSSPSLTLKSLSADLNLTWFFFSSQPTPIWPWFIWFPQFRELELHRGSMFCGVCSPELFSTDWSWTWGLVVAEIGAYLQPCLGSI